MYAFYDYRFPGTLATSGFPRLRGGADDASTGNSLLRNPLNPSQTRGGRSRPIGYVAWSLGIPPRPANGMSIRISPAQSKAARWADSILVCSRGRLTPRAALEALDGRLNFAQSTTFNRFARWVIKPLYLMLYSRPYNPDLAPLVRMALAWWNETLTALPPRIIRDREPSARLRPLYWRFLPSWADGINDGIDSFSPLPAPWRRAKADARIYYL